MYLYLLEISGIFMTIWNVIGSVFFTIWHREVVELSLCFWMFYKVT